MDERILQTLSGNASPSDEEQVRRWRLESPENEAHYQGLVAVWNATEPQPTARTITGVDASVIIAEADRRREQESAAGVVPLRPSSARPGWQTRIPRALAIAAGIAAVAISVRLFNTERLSDLPVPTFTADAGAALTVTLEDGSFVRLSAGSALDTRMTDTTRSVTLTGRAFFAVAHDPTRPFVVRTPAAETRVLGTRFEVAQVDGDVRTIVVDGLVAVTNALGTVEAPAGSMALAVSGSPPAVRHAADIQSLLDWPGGLLLFQDTPLGRVADEIGRTFGRNVVVESAALQALGISGSFEDEGFEEVIQALCDAAGAVCRLTGDGAVISSPNTEAVQRSNGTAAEPVSSRGQ